MGREWEGVRLRQGWHQKDLDVGSKEGLTSATDPARAELLSRTWRVQGVQVRSPQKGLQDKRHDRACRKYLCAQKKRQCL